MHVVSPRRQVGAVHTVQPLVAHTFFVGPGVMQNPGPPHAVQVDATELEHSVQPATFSASTPAHVPPSIRHGVSPSLSHNVHTVPPEHVVHPEKAEFASVHVCVFGFRHCVCDFVASHCVQALLSLSHVLPFKQPCEE